MIGKRKFLVALTAQIGGMVGLGLGDMTATEYIQLTTVVFGVFAVANAKEKTSE